jgi:hypothetical protein
MLDYLRQRIRRQTCTNIDIGGIAVVGIRTMVAGGSARSRQIRQTPAVDRIELAGRRARDRHKYCYACNDVNSLPRLIDLISVISTGPGKFPAPVGGEHQTGRLVSGTSIYLELAKRKKVAIVVHGVSLSWRGSDRFHHPPRSAASLTSSSPIFARSSRRCRNLV